MSNFTHKPVAVRVDLRKGKARLSLMGQSPRGTRFIYNSLVGKQDIKDKKAFRDELAQMVAQLYPEVVE